MAVKSTLWMLGALVSFCLMAVGARELSGDINIFQVLFFRSVIGLLLIFSIIMLTKNRHLVRFDRLGLHAVRNTFHFVGQYGWFVGIGLLPLAEVFALEFTVPLWTALIAFVFLGEQVTTKKLLSVVLGLLGVLIIVQPGAAIVNTASLIVLGSAVCYAITHASTKTLSATLDPLTILLLMCLIQLPLGLCFSLGHWIQPSFDQWLWIVMIGFMAMSAHYCMTRAMQVAELVQVVSLDFLRLPMISVVGVLFYGEHLELSILIGALFMLAGNVLNAYTVKAKFDRRNIR